MVKINGTRKQHIHLNNWAWAHNQKILAFMPDITIPVDKNAIYPIIEMPESISKWLTFNCHLDFVKDFYCELHGIDEIPYGKEIQ